MKSVGRIFFAALLIATGFVPVVISSAESHDMETTGPASRLATYDSSTGQTSFALSLIPQVANDDTLPSDVLILVDTSASQTGLYQTDSIRVVNELLARLNRDDRVRIAAVDLDMVSFIDGAAFVAPDSASAISAVAKLRDRVPLGSTDMSSMLRQVPGVFANHEAGRNRSVIYIGDGVSRAGLIHDNSFAGLVQGLAGEQITFSSYTIGPERDVESMAALANMTGGNLFIDSDDKNSVTHGATVLAQTVHGQVFWPGQVTLPKTVVEIYPKLVPPLRTDRDTIVIGTLSSRDAWKLEVAGQLNGESVTMSWPVAAEASNEDFSFLPGLIETARRGSGSNLPLLGSDGLRETARVMAAGSRTLAQLGTQALVMGNASAARTLAEKALEHDGSNVTAEMLLNAVESKKDFSLLLQDEAPASDPLPPASDPLPQEGPVVQGQEQPLVLGSEQGALQLIGPVSQQDEVNKLIQENNDLTSGVTRMERDQTGVRTTRMQAVVQYELTRATEENRDDPSRAVDRLKSILEILNQTSDIEASTLSDLKNRVKSALDMSRQRKLDFDSQLALQQKADAGRHLQTAQQRALETREEEIARYIGQFNDLMQEQNFEAAADSAYLAYQVSPDLPAANTAQASGRILKAFSQQVELRRLREDNILAVLYEAELSTIPRSGVPPLVFPDREFWNEIKAKRKKYDSVRLSGNDIDESILLALDQPLEEDFIYDEVPFSEVILELKAKYKFNIVIDESALDDGLPEDQLVSANFSGIRLKNALRLMLAKYNSTFIVRDEVLRIISKDVETDPEFFVTNIFNVGDLVAPRINPGGGFGGGGFGGGGQGGGGLGGGGLGGGGLGGGGLGGGGAVGGAGAFCLQDSQPSLEPAILEPVTTPASVGPRARTSWNDYFSKGLVDPATVRDLVRDLMESNQPGEAIELIQAALKFNQTQPWMFEALALAMQIDGRSKADVERAVMSAVDFSTDLADLLIAAKYLADNGMEKRALALLRDLSIRNEFSPEPYVLGLRAATRIDDMDGLRWATCGILSQAWPTHRHVFDQALLVASEVVQRLEKSGRASELTSFRKELDEALHRDLIIQVSWTGDADLDLFVEEPGGTVCSHQVPLTISGGIMMGDAYPRSSSDNGATHEYYVLPRGFSGDYRAVVRKVSGNLTGDRATVTVFGHFNSDRQTSQTKQLSVDDKGVLILFALDNGRRQESIEEKKLERLATEQFVNSRALMAQQMNTTVSGSALSDYLSSRRSNQNSGQLAASTQIGNDGIPFPGGLRRPGAVGYQPNVTQFPTGTFMQVNHATTSDRLYVLISASPQITEIVSVSNFNIAGNAGNATGGGGIGGGGGGIGGIGGGGGGGLGGGGLGGGAF